VNLISNIGYAVTKNEIKHGGYKGKPDVKTFSVGVRAEKDFKAADSVTITPHAGIRYMNVDMESFNAGGFRYSARKLNLAQIPVGVAVSGDFEFKNGAKVKPFADVTVSPALGNKKAKNTFGLEGAAVSDTYSARVSNNALYQGKVGLSASKGSHSLAVSYGLGAGSGSRFDQTLQVKYRLNF
jgi:outer membrane autotransporter protein